MKIVEAYGEQLRVPDWTNYIAVDGNNDICAFVIKPIINDTFSQFDLLHNNDIWDYACTIDGKRYAHNLFKPSEDFSWAGSLINLQDCECILIPNLEKL